LILLHGGPGLGETALFRHFNAPLETYFTAVYWDQRGTGKSYYPTISPSSMTVEQFIGDLNELIDAVCERHAPVTHRDLNANANRLIWTA
jgi:proline iminopeptidase